MKKWMIIGIVIVLIVLWQSVEIYVTVQADKNDDVAQYKKLVPETYTIEQTYRYNGQDRYMVFSVKDDNQEQAFYYVSDEGNTHTIKYADIKLTKEKGLQMAQEDYPEISRIHRVTPAYTGHDFTWEIIAVDSEQQIQYLYYSMTKGTFQKRFTLSN